MTSLKSKLFDTVFKKIVVKMIESGIIDIKWFLDHFETNDVLDKIPIEKVIIYASDNNPFD